jgi:segregation and condensation protein B
LLSAEEEVFRPMSPAPDPPFESQPQGISLDVLAEAFAQVMGGTPRRAADAAVPGGEPPPAPPAAEAGDAPPLPAEPAASTPIEAEDSCPLNPRTILEAMLFVGNRENRPLSVARAAELMRDVELDEIPPLVDELNRSYEARGAAYRIVGEGDGYRLTLCRELHSLRDRFYGRLREARLSQAAIDVLALVAYQQPLTGEKIGQLRGRPSNHVLAQLVRRRLLRIERPETKPRAPLYYTTDRFLQLFNLQTLADLPRSEDAGPP